PEEHYYRKLSAFSSRLTTLYLLDTIYLTYFSSDYDNYLKKKEEYYHHLHQYFKSEH
ncbi:MAG TPA: MurR/RpiR family transcriptional regulator, partial [Erysipelotrichaceae bacterium]|nr:MurR/RpiR family transcriptional regulator [Erysipelotrichaceae bacterium]